MNSFRSTVEPAYPIVKNPKEKTDLAKDPEKCAEWLIGLDIKRAIIIQYQ